MGMRKSILPLAALVGVASVSPVQAATTVTFDDAPIFATVDGTYADKGVVFQTGDWLIIPWFAASSAPAITFSQSGSGFIDFTKGTKSVGLTYGAFYGSSISFYSGLDGTGSLIDTFIIAQNDPNAGFDPLNFALSGKAYSAVVSSLPGTLGIDNLTFASAVPEPASWALMILGFGFVAQAMRKRAVVRRQTVTFAL